MADGKSKKNVGDEIDRNLRRVYDDMLEDDVPERFEELLRRLREQSAPK